MSAEILAELKVMNGKLDAIKETTDGNSRTLRGHNSTPGMVGKVDQNCKDIERLEEKSNRNDAIVGIGTIIGTIAGVIFGPGNK